MSKTSVDSRGCQKHRLSAGTVSDRRTDSTVQSARESAALIVGALTNTRGGLAAAGASVTHRARGCACAWGGGRTTLSA